MNVGDRPTGDLVVLMLAAMVALVALLSATAVLVLAVLDPARDLTLAIQGITDFMGIIVGAVVGFVAGRSPVRRRS